MIGRKLGRYHVLEKLGSGGMGEVYKARDDHLEREVAIKVLPSGSIPDEQAKKRFRKEALALSRLSHPNIATIFDFDSIEDVDYIVMEYVPGETLEDKLSGGVMEKDDLIRFGVQMASALKTANEAGVVHRDLKPKNIMVMPGGRIKILDFGLAKLLRPAGETMAGDSLTRTLSVMGTPAYMSPEQLGGEKVGPVSDLFSMGIVLYEAATGKNPFVDAYSQSMAYNIMHTDPEPPSSIRSELTSDIDAIVMRLLEKRPEDRYGSAGDAERDLLRLEQGKGLRKSSSGRSSYIRWAAIGLPVLLVAMFLFQYFSLAGYTYETESTFRTIRRLTVTGKANVPSWSPDGKNIAYNQDNKTFVIPATGGTPRLLEAEWGGYAPWSWTPDGGSVLVHGYLRAKNIYYIGRLGLYDEEPQVLRENAVQPSMSPDGKFLLFTTVKERRIADVWCRNIETGEERLVAKSPDESTTAFKAFFSPDGEKISYMFWDGYGHKLKVINRDGTDDREVQADPIQLGGLYCWTNDSESVLIAGQLHGIWSIWRINISGMGHTRMTPGSERERHVSLAPDGERFVFGRQQDLSRIAVVDIDSLKTFYPLELDVAAKCPSFSKDGNELYFQALVNEQWQIWKAPIDKAVSPRPIITVEAMSCSDPVCGPDGNVIHRRSEVARQVLWGHIKWSETAWISSPDGGMHNRIENAGEHIRRFAPSCNVNNDLLYTTSVTGDNENLFILKDGGEPRLVFEDRENDIFSGFDWGTKPDEFVVAHLDTSLSKTSPMTVSSINMETLERQRIFTLPEIDIDGQTGVKGYIANLALSPGRGEIAFILYSRGRGSLVVYNIEEGAARIVKISVGEGNPVNLAWAPDGKKIAVELARAKSDIYISQPSEMLYSSND